MIDIIKGAVLYAISAAIGFSAAWWVQSLNVTAAKQALTTLEQSVKQARIDDEEAKEKARLAAQARYIEVSKQLENANESHETYRRCVAAGRCGVRVERAVCAGSGVTLSPRVGVDAGGANTVPAQSGAATEVGETLANECAVTTLRLNQLQASIEAQANLVIEGIK